MPLYYFNLKQGLSVVRDPEGTELPDDASAHEHATVVARELMHNNKKRTRTWRLQVCDARQNLQFELPFASVEDLIAQSSDIAFRPLSRVSTNALPDG
jgi:hypothetical protein